MRELTANEIEMVDGAGVTADGTYQAAIGVAIGLVAVMTLPVSAPMVVTAFLGSLLMSGVAHELATKSK